MDLCFSWDAETIGRAGAISFTILQMIAYTKQGWVVWREKSVSGISVPWFVFSHLALWQGFIYGGSVGNQVIASNGLGIGTVTLVILIGIRRFQGFTKKQKVLFGPLIGLLTVSIFSPDKTPFFFVFSIGNVYFFSLQPKKLWQEKKNGVVRPEILLVMIGSTGFWSAYSIAIGDPVLRIICPVYFVLGLITLTLWTKNWLHARKSEAAAT